MLERIADNPWPWFGALIACSMTFAKDTHGSTSKFDHSEYMQATASGQKKAAPPVKGSLCYDADAKTVSFTDEKGGTSFSIKYVSIKSLLYEKTSTPRYAEAILISPLFLLSHSKKHFLTIQYTDDAGAGQFVIVHMDKKYAREVVAAAEAQTGKKVEQVEEK